MLVFIQLLLLFHQFWIIYHEQQNLITNTINDKKEQYIVNSNENDENKDKGFTGDFYLVLIN
jgi:hypothetical protein